MTVVLLLHPKINCMTIPPGGAGKKIVGLFPTVVISAIIFPGLFEIIHLIGLN